MFSNYFTRSQPKSQLLKPAPSRKIKLPASQRLSTIVEGPQAPVLTSPPVSPGQSQSHIHPARRTRPIHSTGNRPHNAWRWHNLGPPPRESEEKPPPSYSQFSSSGGSVPEDRDAEGGFLARMRERRGGWKRLALIVLAVLLVIIGLAVGLGVGLGTRKNNSNSKVGSGGSGSTNSSANNPTGPFPIGNWNFDVVLASVSTACTANPDTWTCYPYSTYTESPAQSAAVFNWIVSAQDPTTPSNNSLSIASSPNVFSLSFPSTPLTLLDANTPNERWEFSLKLPKVVFPSQSLTADNARTECFFNQTMLTASLYVSNATSAMASPTTTATWPGTVYVQQYSPGGTGTPDCYPSNGSNVTGPAIVQGLTAQPASSQCSCAYESSNSTSTSR